MAATLNAEYVRSIFDYDADCGKLIWRYREDKPKKWNSRCAGQYAGVKNPRLYSGITIDGKSYQCHQVIWLYHYGEWPSSEIDHINLCKQDNRIENLRVVNRSQNMHNITAQKDNMSGYKGVSWHKRAKKWQVHLQVNFKKLYCGLFECPELAHLVYSEHAASLCGEYVRTA